jgi:cell division septation protein DedD
MLRSDESETEILLGNKQLLGIFFAVAVLLGIAFYGGYVVGRGAKAHAATTAATTVPATEPAPTPANPPSGGETHSVPAESGTPSEPPPAADTSSASAEPPPLGTPKRKNVENRVTSSTAAPGSTAAPSEESFAPRSGQTFLQVTATGRDEAFAIADVLQKKGFPAHAVPKVGTKFYRVLVGPVHDTADLSSTRDSLRRTGFREVIVQHY